MGDMHRTKAQLIKTLRQEQQKLVGLERALSVNTAPTSDQAASEPAHDTLGRHSQMVFDSISDAVSIIDASNFRIIDANKAFLEQYDLRRMDVIGDTCHRVTHHRHEPCEPPLDPCPLYETVQTGRPTTVDHIHYERGGRKVFVEITTFPMFDHKGKVASVVHISRDITERKQAEEERKRLIGDLETAQAELEQLFNEAPCYISVLDKNFRLTAANRVFKEDFGECPASRCFETYKHRRERCFPCSVQDTFEDGLSHSSEEIVTTKDNRQRHVLVRTAPLLNRDGEIDRVMHMSTDITEIRELQDRLSSLGLMIGSMSHGVKGLLTGLDGGMYQLKTGFEKQDRGRLAKGFEVVKTMVGRIRNMVLDILYYTKERRLDLEVVDVLEFTREIAETIRPKAAKHGIEFVLEMEEEPGELEADSAVLGSALINILENGIEAALEDKSSRKRRLIFRLATRDDAVIFHVIDNGIGLDAETKNNMFTLFFSSKGSKGTGLGLFISHEIIQQHRGTIEVESQLGRGSHFTITLPRKQEKDWNMDQQTLDPSCHGRFPEQ